MSKIKFQVGNRYIVREDRPLAFRVEVGVLEISPTEKYIKFNFPSGYEVWEEVEDWVIIEELGG